MSNHAKTCKLMLQLKKMDSMAFTVFAKGVPRSAWANKASAFWDSSDGRAFTAHLEDTVQLFGEP